MTRFADPREEVDGRNRELRRYTFPASPSSRKLFNDYIELTGDAQVEGWKKIDRAQYETTREALRLRAEVACSEAEARMVELLARTSRRRSLDLQSVEHVSAGPSYARFAWILAVAGTDTAEDIVTLQEYFAAASTWFAESLIRYIATSAESSLLNIQPAAMHSRMDAGSTRFRWICGIFADAIDNWATERGGDAAEIFGGGRTTRFAELIRDALPLPDERVLLGLHPKLIDALTADPKQPSAFARLIEGNGAETTPLVKIDGRVHVGNASALVFGLETVLIAGIQATLGSGAQGDAFEYATQYIADRLLPPSISTARDSYVSDTMTGSEGDEVDLDVFGKALEVIVETKSHLPAKDAASAAASYQELLKANRQIRRRVDRLLSGKWIRRSRVSRSDYVGGIIVSLHDYTNQAWKPESMVESGTDAFAVLPIQAFAMVLGCVESPAELSEYLKLRTAIGFRQVSGGDELEIVLGWLSGTRAEDIPDDAAAKVQFRPYSIDTDSLLAIEWADRSAWRRYLIRASRAIHK